MTEKSNETVKCPHCYSDIDSRATVCPHCRRKINTGGGNGRLILLLLILAGIAWICFSSGGSDDSSTSSSVADSRPRATNTPRPLPNFSPISLSGSGDSIEDIDKTDAPAIVDISYTGDGNFAVWNHDVSGERLDLLVNTIGRYNGTVPIDFLADEHTGRFEIEADGSWTIRVRPLSAAQSVSVPGSVSGSGDEVLRLTGRAPDTAEISNSGEGNFAVWSYGNRRDLLVNEIGSYSGTVILDADTLVIVVSSEGSWSIEISD